MKSETELMVDSLEAVLKHQFKDKVPYIIKLSIENVRNAILIDSTERVLNMVDQIAAAQGNGRGRLQ